MLITLADGLVPFPQGTKCCRKTRDRQEKQWEVETGGWEIRRQTQGKKKE